MRRVTTVLAALAVAATALGQARAQVTPAVYTVGFAKRSVNPDADGTFAGKPLHLGGYGFGHGEPWASLDLERAHASGILGTGIHARAMVVSTDDDPAHALALLQIENIGMFVAYQQGPYGLLDIRRGIEGAVGIPAERVIAGGNHSHAGPDLLGVWGGVPTEYLAFVKHQAIGAVKDAWRARRAATLWLGTAPATGLTSNQFSYDPANQVVDAQMRVLQARAPGSSAVIGTLVNLSAHPTVMGGDNTLISADWPGPAADALAVALGGEALAIPGALGRSQPNDGPDYGACGGDQYCALNGYATRVAARAQQAVASAQPLEGAAVVDAHSYLVVDPFGHNALLLGLTMAGEPFGVPIKRSALPPWIVGNTIGTITSSARIGDLLFSGGPGELYPQITETVRALTAPYGVRASFVFGLAGDMLGYIIAPFPEAYPEPIRRSFFNRGDPNDPTTWEPSIVDNDNYFFNVSHTLGERIICSMLRGAGAVLAGNELQIVPAYPKCAAMASDLALPAGADTLMPTTP